MLISQIFQILTDVKLDIKILIIDLQAMLFTRYLSRNNSQISIMQSRSETPDWKVNIEEKEKKQNDILNQVKQVELKKKVAKEAQFLSKMEEMVRRADSEENDTIDDQFRICINCLLAVNVNYREEHEQNCKGFAKLKMLSKVQLLSLIDKKIALKEQFLKLMTAKQFNTLGNINKNINYNNNKNIIKELKQAKEVILAQTHQTISNQN